MEKRLCQLNRQAIHDYLPKLHRLLVEPQFMCRSCARACSDANLLCKPTPIAPKPCQSPSTPLHITSNSTQKNHVPCALAREAQGVNYFDPYQASSSSIEALTVVDKVKMDERAEQQEKAQRKIAKIKKKQQELVVKRQSVKEKQDKLQRKEQKYAQKLQKAQHKLQQLREI